MTNEGKILQGRLANLTGLLAVCDIRGYNLVLYLLEEVVTDPLLPRMSADLNHPGPSQL